MSLQGGVAANQKVANDIEKEFTKFKQEHEQAHPKVSLALASSIESLRSLRNSVQNSAGSFNQAEVKKGVAQVAKQLDDKKAGVVSEFKTVHDHLSKFGRVVDKSFCTDYDGALVGEIDCFRADALRVCFEYLYREGYVAEAEALKQRESKEVAPAEWQRATLEVAKVVRALECGDVMPGLEWCSLNRQELEQLDTTIEFSFHRLAFLRILLGNAFSPLSPSLLSSSSRRLHRSHLHAGEIKGKEEVEKVEVAMQVEGKMGGDVRETSSEKEHQQEGVVEVGDQIEQKMDVDDDGGGVTIMEDAHPEKRQMQAMAYAQKFFPPFSASCMHDISKLMACLVFADRLESSPYSRFASTSMWGEVKAEFLSVSSSISGLSKDNHLHSIIDASTLALPAYLRVKAMTAANNLAVDIMPAEVELGKKAAFHSIFTCPVSKDQGTVDNPPVMLSCGHVVSQGSVGSLSRGTRGTRGGSRLKCPTCPEITTLESTKVLHF